MAVEVDELRSVCKEIPVRLLTSDQPLHAVLYNSLILARLMRVARTEECQHGQTSGCCVRLKIADVAIIVAGKIVNCPVTIRMLVSREPFEPSFDRVLGFF